MNDTIFTSRQKEILNLLRRESVLSRTTIVAYLPATMDSAPITILRDINDLIKKGYIVQEGRARATRYRLREDNPLLRYIDLDEYFKIGLDERDCKVTFDADILSHLTKLHAPQECRLWDYSAKQFARQESILTPTLYKRELERFLIDLAWKSSQIEGNTYDLIETETLLKEKIRAKGHLEEEALMILNHKAAFEFIRKNKLLFAKPLTCSLIIRLHSELIKGMEIQSGLRSQQVRITGTRYIPPSGRGKTSRLFEKVVNAINNASYPPDKAFIAASMIAYLQPFADGNKRTSRMLSNAILFSNGYYPLSYRNIDVTEYRKAIILLYEQNNLYHFKRLWMEQLSFALEHYFQ